MIIDTANDPLILSQRRATVRLLSTKVWRVKLQKVVFLCQ